MDPPTEYLARIAAEGKSTEISWRLRRQLPGRRQAGQMWCNHFTNILEDAGFVRCEAAPQFFRGENSSIRLEVHMDDGHGCGTKADIVEFIDMVKKKLSIKGGEPIEYGVAYSHLKRFRVRHPK